MRMRKGLMLLDALIIILAVGVIASLLMPYLRTEREVKLRNACRNRMQIISNLELKYFETAGGKISPEEEKADTTETAEKSKDKKAEKDTTTYIRTFTKNVEELKKMLSEEEDTFDFVCPLDGRPFIIVARDSFFFSISCPNGHGQVIMGSPTWENK